MKKILHIFLFAGLFTTMVKAQQDIQYTQFMFSKLAYNPGYAGSEGRDICATLMWRSQWLGFSSGSGIAPPVGYSDIGSAPVSLLGTIHTALGDHFGVGVSITNDKIGFQNNLNPILSASYRYTFKNSSTLSAGIGAGLMQQSLAGSKLNPLDKDDPLVPKSDVVGNTFDLNFGLYYTMPSLWKFTELYAGLSSTHLNQGTISYGSIQTEMRRHYYFNTGAAYTELMGGQLALEPNILVKFDQAKLTTDVNVMAMYKNKYRGGLTYRSIDAFSLLAGYKFTPKLQIGASYDFTTTQIRDFSNGTIEVMLKYCFTPKLGEKPDKPPIPRLTPRFL